MFISMSASILVGAAFLPWVSCGFAGHRPKIKAKVAHVMMLSTTEPTSSRLVDAVPVNPANINPEASRLKDELLSLASLTKRGFKSNRKQKEWAKDLIDELASLNPTKEPAASYYESAANDGAVDGAPTLSGKWTLVYTDAPDITSLDGGPFATAKLGRIGQECSPPYIKNIIEWQRPDWAKSLPLSGSDQSRVLQKVCCEAAATPENPTEVDLLLVGLDIVGSDDGGGKDDRSIADRMQDGPAGLFQDNPVELRGPLKAPFGKFKILYLDAELRIIKTSQNFYACNVREEEWF